MIKFLLKRLVEHLPKGMCARLIPLIRHMSYDFPPYPGAAPWVRQQLYRKLLKKMGENVYIAENVILTQRRWSGNKASLSHS